MNATEVAPVEPAAEIEEPTEAPPPPAPAERELRCTLCGLRACWTG
jgi:hypothetical protein